MQNSSSIPLDSTNTFLWDRFRIFEFNNDESILKVFSKKPETDYIIKAERFEMRPDNNNYYPNAFFYQMTFSPEVQFYERYPE